MPGLTASRAERYRPKTPFPTIGPTGTSRRSLRSCWRGSELKVEPVTEHEEPHERSDGCEQDRETHPHNDLDHDRRLVAVDRHRLRVPRSPV